MKKKQVGRSSRTPFKHWILNAELGRLMGIFASRKAVKKVPVYADPFVIVDLCAGDGVTTDEFGTCSPAVILKHTEWGRNHNVSVDVTMIEKSANTFESLASSVNSNGILLLNSDANDFVLQVRSNQACFINADPNHINDLPISDELIDSFTPATTFLITLGCNVGGLKRLPISERMKWFDLVERITGNIPSWHDALLVRLIKDDKQWAYLLRLPSAWTNRTACRLRDIAETMWPKGVSITSLKYMPDEFAKELDILFKTKEERSNANS